MYTLIYDDATAKQMNIDDSEIPALLDSGFVTGVLRLNKGVIEFADVDFEEWTMKWSVPAKSE